MSSAPLLLSPSSSLLPYLSSSNLLSSSSLSSLFSSRLVLPLSSLLSLLPSSSLELLLGPSSSSLLPLSSLLLLFKEMNISLILLAPPPSASSLLLPTSSSPPFSSNPPSSSSSSLLPSAQQEFRNEVKNLWKDRIKAEYQTVRGRGVFDWSILKEMEEVIRGMGVEVLGTVGGEGAMMRKLLSEGYVNAVFSSLEFLTIAPSNTQFIVSFDLQSKTFQYVNSTKVLSFFNLTHDRLQDLFAFLSLPPLFTSSTPSSSHPPPSSILSPLSSSSNPSPSSSPHPSSIPIDTLLQLLSNKDIPSSSLLPPSLLLSYYSLKKKLQNNVVLTSQGILDYYPPSFPSLIPTSSLLPSSFSSSLLPTSSTRHSLPPPPSSLPPPPHPPPPSSFSPLFSSLCSPSSSGLMLPLPVYYLQCMGYLSKEMAFALSTGEVTGGGLPFADSVELRSLIENEYFVLLQKTMALMVEHLHPNFKNREYQFNRYYTSLTLSIDCASLPKPPKIDFPSKSLSLHLHPILSGLRTFVQEVLGKKEDEEGWRREEDQRRRDSGGRRELKGWREEERRMEEEGGEREEGRRRDEGDEGRRRREEEEDGMRRKENGEEESREEGEEGQVEERRERDEEGGRRKEEGEVGRRREKEGYISYIGLTVLELLDYLSYNNRTITVLGSGLRKSESCWVESLLLILELMKSGINHIFGRLICDAVKLRKLSIEESPRLKRRGREGGDKLEVREELAYSVFLNVLEAENDLIICVSRVFSFVAPSTGLVQTKKLFDYDCSQYLSILRYVQSGLGDLVAAVLVNLCCQKKYRSLLPMLLATSGQLSSPPSSSLPSPSSPSFPPPNPSSSEFPPSSSFPGSTLNLPSSAPSSPVLPPNTPLPPSFSSLNFLRLFKSPLNVEVGILVKKVLQMKSSSEFEDFAGDSLEKTKEDLKKGLELWGEIVNLVRYQEKKGEFNEEVHRLFESADEFLRSKFKELRVI